MHQKDGTSRVGLHWRYGSPNQLDDDLIGITIPTSKES